MANNTLAQIRARLAAAEQNSGNFDKATFPFWNAKNDTTSVLRFLPDGNTSNDFFWVEKQQIKLKFNGIKGGDQKPVYVNVPCVEMFGKEAYPQGCPILREVRAWYKEGSGVSKELANQYWKKPTYILQGFVRSSAVEEKDLAENPIRRFSLNKQLFNLVKAGLMDAEMENMPCDYEKGTDFSITKTQKGAYADYGTSKYSRKESPLTKVELDAIEKYTLLDLSQFLGKQPSEKDLEIIEEMFAASVDGEPYDNARWGNFYRPAGVKSEKKEGEEAAGSDTETASEPAAEPKTEVKETPKAKVTPKVEEKTDAKGKTSASDIMAMIKSRQSAKTQS